MKKTPSRIIKSHAKIVLTLTIILGIAALGFGSYKAIQYISGSQSHLSAPPTEIVGKKVTLKQLTEADFVDYHNMFSSTVRKNLEFPEVITLGYTIRYLHDEMKKSRNGTMLQYCIFDNVDKKLIGSIEIRDKNERDPGQLGAWINEAYWGQGRYQEALDLITKTYFKLKPNEKNYLVYVRLWNKRSYQAHKKYGMKDIGYAYANGKPSYHIFEYRP